MDLVSVIIPSFNRELLIAETLDSILAQTYSSWEAIVVDDGSADNTCQLVKSYSDRDQRIKLIQRNREPKGASVCRNIGLENAKGKYVIFLDSDDLLSPDCLENRVRFMNEHPELNFAVFQMICFDEKGLMENLKLTNKRDSYLHSYLRHDLPWTITGPIWTDDFIKKHLKGFNESYPRLQDPEFNTRALLVENVRFEVLFNSKPDSFYRSHFAKAFNVAVMLKGFNLYISEFLPLVKNRADYEECRKQLKQCYIEALRSFYSYYEPKYRNESIKLIGELRKTASKGHVIGPYTGILTTFLTTAYSMNLAASSAGKKVLKLIMKLIKMS